jgi:hypothetical protein
VGTGALSNTRGCEKENVPLNVGAVCANIAKGALDLSLFVLTSAAFGAATAATAVPGALEKLNGVAIGASQLDKEVRMALLSTDTPYLTTSSSVYRM